MNAPISTLDAARAVLRAELAEVDPDNPVQAVRRVAAVARRFTPKAPTSWEAFRWTAEELVRPFFEARAMPAHMAAVWAVCDPFFGKLDRAEDEHESEHRDQSERQVRVSVGGAGGR